ncbi:hypothetical protein J6590_025447 [Homalodisca vitripennis]|nr:hypothetical protein J6590_025447 [Homalodisca vitripennis]
MCSPALTPSSIDVVLSFEVSSPTSLCKRRMTPSALFESITPYVIAEIKAQKDQETFVLIHMLVDKLAYSIFSSIPEDFHPSTSRRNLLSCLSAQLLRLYKPQEVRVTDDEIDGSCRTVGSGFESTSCLFVVDSYFSSRPRLAKPNGKDSRI